MAAAVAARQGTGQEEEIGIGGGGEAKETSIQGGKMQLPKLQVDPGRRLENGEFTQVSTPLLEMASNERSESDSYPLGL